MQNKMKNLIKKVVALAYGAKIRFCRIC